MPREGPVLVMGRQPMRVSSIRWRSALAVRRRLHYLARTDRFQHPAFRKLLRSVGGARGQEGFDREGIRGQHRSDEGGQGGAVFPRGERTPRRQDVDVKPESGWWLNPGAGATIVRSAGWRSKRTIRAINWCRPSPFFWKPTWGAVAGLGRLADPAGTLRPHVARGEGMLEDLFTRFRHQVERAEKLRRRNSRYVESRLLRFEVRAELTNAWVSLLLIVVFAREMIRGDIGKGLLRHDFDFFSAAEAGARRCEGVQFLAQHVAGTRLGRRPPAAAGDGTRCRCLRQRDQPSRSRTCRARHGGT